MCLAGKVEDDHLKLRDVINVVHSTLHRKKENFCYKILTDPKIWTCGYRYLIVFLFHLGTNISQRRLRQICFWLILVFR